MTWHLLLIAAMVYGLLNIREWITAPLWEWVMWLAIMAGVYGFFAR